MGQKPSNLGGRFSSTNKLPFHQWIFNRNSQTTHNPNPEQPIKFQYKTNNKRNRNVPESEDKNQNQKTNNNNNNNQTLNNFNNYNNSNKSINQSNLIKNTNNDNKCRIIKTQLRTKSEPNLLSERQNSREKCRRRSRKNTKIRNNHWNDEENEGLQQFGYEIQDVDAFLTKASIEKPANIPVVLAFPSVLYQTRIGGYQSEISLPLGMVVNAIFKNQHWLYVQTPHAEEGYVSYAACLPLGIIPPPDDDTPTPCWEKSTDIFPKPSGNMTDTEKLSSKSDCGDEIRCYSRRLSSRNAMSTCGEKSVDRLYLRATASAKRNQFGIIRQTLLVINNNYFGNETNALHVRKGDVVFLIHTHIRGWFWVRNKDGEEGFIPAVIAGHGFL